VGAVGCSGSLQPVEYRLTHPDTQDLQGRGIRPKPRHDAATPGYQQSSGLIVFLPEMGASRHWSDYIGGVVVADDPPVGAEEKPLPAAVRMYGFRKDDIDTCRYAAEAEHTIETSHAKRERENVIVPKSVSEEIESVERGPAAQFREALEGTAVVTAFQQDGSAGSFDSHIAISEVPALLFVRIPVENGDALVREYLDFTG